MGGVIALQLAVDYAQLIDKLVLVNTFSQFRILDLSTALYYTWRFILSHFVSLSAQAQSVTHRLFPRPDQVGLRQILYEQILQAQPDTYLKTMRALVRFNLTDQLKEIRLPTLIVTGEKDSTVHPRLQKLLADRIPAARQVTIAGAGHAVIAEEPDQFNRILLEFLGRPVEYVSPEVTNGSQPLPSASQFDRK
jgi:pimeloyl-ACP methyl ester carboxylesterase